MKLKRRPDDFRVEELPAVEPAGRGRFVFYRLTKTGLGTLEAVEAIRRRWNLSGGQIGLWGAQGQACGDDPVSDDPRRPGASAPRVEPGAGADRPTAHPYGPAHFRGNRFDLVLRDLSAEAAARAEAAAAQVPTDGLPNYFDDQRFGSVGFDGGFIAEAWLKGDHERALRLAIAEANAADRPDSKVEKAILRDHWGDWSTAKAKLQRSHARSLVTYLVDHPTDFRGAFARVRRELRTLYFSAYQSYLWNRLLARLIERTTRPEQRIDVDFKLGPLPLQRGLDAEQSATLRSWRVPLPASRTPLPDGPARDLAMDVLGEIGLAWEDLRVKHLKDVFFSKGDRPAVVVPEHLLHRVEADELYPGRLKLSLGFELPKGAYATLLVKRLTDAA